MITTTTITNEQLYLEGRYDELFERNTDFIWHMYKKYPNIYIEREEFFSLSGLAFTMVLKDFDPSKAKFISIWGIAIHRRILNYLKSYKRKEKYGIEMVSLDNDSNDIPFHEIVLDHRNSIDEYLDSQDKEIIQDCIQKLTKKQQQVYELYLQGYTQQAIADKLNVTRQAVGNAIKKGKVTLIEELRKSDIC